MRGLKPSVALASVAVIGLALWANAYVDQSGSRMAAAASRLLVSLDESQSKQATFEFDSPERLNWHFIPRERKGLPVKEMTGAQRALAFGLLNTGVSASGSLKATTIMSLEQILKDLEQGKGPVRDPERYFITIFGKPSDKGRWGWRIEGHHLSLNFTLQDGKVVSASPAFFGANPAEVRQGPREGLRALADREERALRLVQALKDDQKKIAVVVEKAPADIRAANAPQPPTEASEGISFAQLNGDQRPLLQALVESYAEDMPPDVASAWLDELKKAGVEDIRFAWQGATDRTEGHGYKIQGPTFLIEFNNTQNGANHIHSVWRNMLGDFGVPLASK